MHLHVEKCRTYAGNNQVFELQFSVVLYTESWMMVKTKPYKPKSSL